MTEYNFDGIPDIAQEPTQGPGQFNFEGIPDDPRTGQQQPEASPYRVLGRFFSTIINYPGRQAAAIRSELEASNPEDLPNQPYIGFEPTFIANGIDQRTNADAFYERMSDVQKAQVNAMALDKQNAQGIDFQQALADATVEMVKKEREDFIPTLKGIEQTFGPLKGFEGQSSGVAEDIAGGVATSITSLPQFFINPILGLVSVAGDIKGAKVQELELQGATDKAKINQAANLNAALQTPLEALSDLFVLSKILKPSGRWTGFVVDVGESMAGEGVTEYAQQHPDEMATIMALNPDVSGEQVVNFFLANIADIEQNSLYAGLVGMLSAGVTAGGGKTINGLINGFITPEQQAINEHKRGRLQVLVEKSQAGTLTDDELKNLQDIAGMPDQDAADIVKEVQRRIEIQAPIESDAREQAAQALRERYGNDQVVSDELAIMDQFARTWAERNDKNPADFYNEILSVRAGDIEQFQAEQAALQDGALNQAPADDPVHAVAKGFNEQFPGNDIRYDGEMDLSPIGKPNMYQFTVYDGPLKKATFITAEPTVEAIKAKLGDLQKQYGKALFQVDVWHGSPHEFEKFSTEKVGSGEGSQAFGWGIYFTDQKDIASYYKDVLSKDPNTDILTAPKYKIGDAEIQVGMHDKEPYRINSKTPITPEEKAAIKEYERFNGDVEKAKKSLIESEFNQPTNRNAADIVGSIKKQVYSYLYKATLHEGKDPSEYTWLDWGKNPDESTLDKILSQAKKEKLFTDDKSFLKYYNDEIDQLKNDYSKRNNSILYSALSDELGSDKKASMFLARSGIDGIRYPAGALSGGGEGTNYVVFDENAVTIKEINGEKLRALFQSDRKSPPSPRGAVQNLFGQGKKIVQLFESADPSTPIHELAHIATGILAGENAEDYSILADWAGVDPERAAQGINAWTTAEHEKVARAFEAYIMEGQAPTHRLQAIFTRLKQILIDIYKSVTSLDVQLSDAVRDVFDRMVATEFERNANPLFDIDEWTQVVDNAASIDLSERSTMEDVEAVAKSRVLERVIKERKSGDRKAKAAFRAQVREQVAQYPIFRLLSSLRESGLDYDALMEEYDKAKVKEILRRHPGVVRKGGASPWAIMSEWGYDDLDTFIADILAAPKKGQAEQQMFDRLWGEHQRARLAEDGKIYQDYLDEVLNIVGNLTQQKVKGAAKGNIRASLHMNKDEEYRQMVADFRRDQRVAREAYAAGKRDEAVKLLQVQRERITEIKRQHQMRAAKEKIDNRMQRHWKNKSLPVQYRAQIVAFLNEYYNIPDSFKIAPDQTLDAFLADKEAAESWIVDSIRAELTRKPVQRRNQAGSRIPLTEAERDTVARIADMLAHMGRVERWLIAEGKQVYIDEQVDAMVNSAIDTFNPDPADPLAAPPSARRLNWFKALSKGAREYLAELRKSEFILQALDGWKFDGPNWQIFQSLKKAEDSELTMGGQFFERVKSMFDDRGFDRKWALKKYEIPGRRESWTKEELIMVALNSGNDGNRAALRESNYALSDKTIDHIVNQVLTDDERALVDDIWNLLDELYPHLNGVHKQLTGVDLPKVEGRYFPLVFDRELSWKAQTFSKQAAERDLFANAYTRPNVEAGHRKTRTGGKLEPLLSFSVIQRHLVNTIHDVTHQIPVRDAQRLINDPRYREAVSASLGVETYKQLNPWLSDVARPRYEPATKIDKLVGRLRRNATIVGLGLKVTVAQKQVLSITQTIDELGLKPVMKAISHFYAHPQQTAEFIKESSVMMRNRRRQWDRELSQFTGQFDPGKLKSVEYARDAFFAMIGVMDSAATYPTWLAGYEVGMNQFNYDHDKAVEFADQVVRRTQPVASPKDLSTIQRGGETRSELRKLFTMFYTFFSGFQNRMQETNQRLKVGDINIIEAAKSYWWILVFPAAMSGLISKRKWPWELGIKDYLKEITGYYVAAFPFFRDLISPIITGHEYTMSPVEQAGESVVKLGKALQANEIKGRTVAKEATKVAGYTFGLPSSQMIITMDGLIDLMEGKTDNPARLLFSEDRKK
jgi:hypothetical protein